MTGGRAKNIQQQKSLQRAHAHAHIPPCKHTCARQSVISQPDRTSRGKRGQVRLTETREAAAANTRTVADLHTVTRDPIRMVPGSN